MLEESVAFKVIALYFCLRFAFGQIEQEQIKGVRSGYKGCLQWPQKRVDVDHKAIRTRFDIVQPRHHFAFRAVAEDQDDPVAVVSTQDYLLDTCLNVPLLSGDKRQAAAFIGRDHERAPCKKMPRLIIGEGDK